MPDIQTIIQGGAVGIAVLLIILIIFILKRVFELISNHIAHSTDAIKELTVVVNELKTWLKMKNGN